MLLAGEIAAKMGAGPEWADAMGRAAAEFGIVTPLEIAHWLAQVSVECMGFKRMLESLDYSVEALIAEFDRDRISAELCYQLGRRDGHPAEQEAIANNIYGGEWGLKHLGNRDPGDGWKFRGHGPAQLTGRSNVAACSTGLFRDASLVNDPTPLTLPEAGARSAAWFWNSRRCNSYAARDNVIACTRAWNGGINGIHQRAERLKFAKHQLGIA